ncbi:MAG: glycosyltransferase [Methylophilaceae bacterium]
MSIKKILFICDAIPANSFSGYQTYNHAFISSLTTQGHQVCLIVTGNSFTSPIFKLSNITGINSIESKFKNARQLYNDIYLISIISLAKLVYRKAGVFKKLIYGIQSKLKNKKTSNAHIGKWLTRGQLTFINSEIENQSPDVVFVDTIFRAPNFPSIKGSFTKILIGHDVFYERCESFAKQNKEPIPNVDIRKEASIVGGFDTVIAISENDEKLYKAMSPATTTITLSAPISPQTSMPIKRDTQQILYIGSNAHHNVDGLRWFLMEIWPKVKLTNPKLTLNVVGNVSSSFNGNFSDVIFHGRVQDIAPIANKAMFAINPVRIGSGMKIKILAYFAYGLPCITTSLGAAGFPEVENTPISACDSVESFANGVIEWSGNPVKCSELSKYAVAFTAHFDADNFDQKLMSLVSN